MRNLVPNMLTGSNLVLGMFGIIATLQGSFMTAALLIFAAMIADGLDGRVARYMKISSDFGKELDSLCDLVSFGVAPALLAYMFMLQEFGMIGAVIAAAFATCGALRLARFNVMAGVVKGYFMGLPIPAAGCAVATFVMVGLKPSGWLFPIMVAVFAYLMVSTIKYPDFKGKGEKIRVIPAVLTIMLMVYILVFSLNAVLFAGFFGYAVFGILNTLFGLFETKTSG
ncbi:MAG TPA: CDP-diacylglycerol--serine O-phosphatidyltransferase [Selenomonadales bacterium]|nr:CDP-diacylglycerol--serine O-phosphatidyltransferase [Selenomonadales bacterium]